jgi:guanylate kinase
MPMLECPVSVRNVLIASAAAGAAYLVLWKLGVFGRAQPAPVVVAATPVAAPPVPASEALNAVVMSGPSGVGKGTLIERVKKEFPTNFAVSVSHTSRAPRAGEVNGVHYHFSTKEEMRAMEARGEFIELTEVHTNLYGTSFAAMDAVRKSGKVCILEVDVQGSQKIKRALAAANSDLRVGYMFVSAPSLAELEARIVKRGGESEDKIKVRLETARREIAFLEANRDHFCKVLVNDDLERAYAEFTAFLRAKGAIPA